MTNYVSMTGIVEEESGIEMPDTLDDLEIIEIPMEMRQENLSTLDKLYKLCKDLEMSLIRDNEDISEEINKIKGIIYRGKIYVSCEICSKDVLCYRNICFSCLKIPESIGYCLMIIRNLLLRIAYLQERISLSLLNKLSTEELFETSNEIAILSHIP